VVLFILQYGHALFGDGVFLHVTPHDLAHGAILHFFSLLSCFGHHSFSMTVVSGSVVSLFIYLCAIEALGASSHAMSFAFMLC